MTQHQVLASLICYYVFSSFVSSLPTPDNKSSKFYGFLFSFTHSLAGNLMRIPQIRSFIGITENPTTESGIMAKAAAQQIDPTVQGISKESK